MASTSSSHSGTRPSPSGRGKPRAAAPPGLAANLTCLLWLGCFLSIGCAGYQLGSASLFNPNIRTLYIPAVRNDTFRQELGPLLTEAIQKEVELRTPFKVVGNPNADSTLTCRVTSETKRTVVQTATDEPRVVEPIFSVELTWTDRQGNVLMENQIIPPGELAFYFIRGVDFVPEAGQSFATTETRAVEELARLIVNQMEVRW